MPQGPRNFKGSAAFTLIEMLVVIAILGVLASLILVGIDKAMDSARQTQCISNLKQVSAAFANHAADYNSTVPCPFIAAPPPPLTDTQWDQRLLQYLQDDWNVMRCPEQRKVPEGQAAYSMSWMLDDDGVEYFEDAGGSIPRGYIDLTYTENASGKMLVADGYYDAGLGYVNAGITKDTNVGEDQEVSFRHKDDRANILFVDGHVGRLSHEEMTTKSAY